MTWKVAGINFDHMHMGDNLRMVHEHPQAEIVGLCDVDPHRMIDAAANFDVPAELCFTDFRQCIDRTRPDIVLLCPNTRDHRLWVENVAPLGVHVILEKPFAATLQDADAIIAAMQQSGCLLAINWPMAWYAGNQTAKRLIDEGFIGAVREVHYYDGNRGPTFHLADKLEVSTAQARAEAVTSWFYKKDSDGGALRDYLGYGTTLGTWFHGGITPLEITTVVDEPAGLEVEEHSLTVARYEHGLSKFETRWGTFTDPWITQPQPKCGFVIVGADGTISSYDMEPTIKVQTRQDQTAHDLPIDEIAPPHQNPVQYMIHCLETASPIEGPLSPELSRVGQLLVDAAVRSAAEKRTIPLTEIERT